MSTSQRMTQLPLDLRALGASPAQIKAALDVLKGTTYCSPITMYCVLDIHKAILTRASYATFSKLLISKVDSKEAFNIQRNPLPIPPELRAIYKDNLSTQDLYELSQKRANLYLTIMERGLQPDGRINPQVSVPEMAVVFEKLEKEFLLLKKAVNINAEGINDFFKTFGFTNKTDLEIISQSFIQSVNSLSTFYDEILSKVTAKGWNGLEYMDLMKFYTGFYTSVDFSNMTSVSEKLNTMAIEDKLRFFSQLSIYNRTDGFDSQILDLQFLLRKGEIALISDQKLSELTPFLTNMAVPVFNLELPSVFMREYDGTRDYSSAFIKHDTLHTLQINDMNMRSSVSSYFSEIEENTVPPSLEKMKSTIREALSLNLKEINNINSILSGLPSKDRDVFYAFMFHSFHESFKPEFAGNLARGPLSLGDGLKKYLNPLNTDFFKKINNYGLSQLDIDNFTARLKNIIKKQPNIFEGSSDAITKAFIKYLKTK